MRSTSATAERAEEARDAARGWKRAGAVDAVTFEEILRRFPEPRTVPSAVWRALTGFFVSIAILAALGMVAVGIRFSDSSAWQILLCFGSLACVAAAELQEASPRLAMRGGVGATSFWAVVFALIALFIFLEERRLVPTDDAITIVLATGAVLWASAGWRWGIPVYVAFSAIAFFAFLARFPAGRVLWIAGGTTLAFASARFFDEKRMAPSHRRALAITCVASLAAVYGAANVYSLDERILEGFHAHAGASPASAPALLHVLSILGTVLVPFFVLAWGLRSRRTFLVDVGVLFLVLSFVTLRHYVHIAPLWAILTGSGAVLLAVAVMAENRLRRVPEGEIAGFTTDALFEDEKKRRALELVPVVVGFGAQAAPPSPAAPEPGSRFEGGGGSGGGGGTTDSY